MKKLLAMALAGAMVLSLTACGSKEDKTTTAAPTEAAGTTAGAEAGTTAAGAENETTAAATDAAKSGEKLIVGTEAGFAPYEYMVGDQVVGIDMDIAQAVADKLGRELEIQNMDFKTAGVLERAGVKTAIMTDHPVSLIHYLPLYAGLNVKHGLSMEGGLKAVTIHAAQICGAADRVGSLEAGKDADIAVFSANPMEVFTKTLYTMIDGEIVYESR